MSDVIFNENAEKIAHEQLLQCKMKEESEKAIAITTDLTTEEYKVLDEAKDKRLARKYSLLCGPKWSDKPKK